MKNCQSRIILFVVIVTRTASSWSADLKKSKTLANG
jgi:hypothetical protein